MKRPDGSRKTKRIAGRGAAARRGVRAGRGDKGQKSRSGGGVKPGFEGGQMPLYRRVARKGFNNSRFTKQFDVVNVGDIASRYAEGETVNRETLIGKGLVSKRRGLPVKVLGGGAIAVAVTVDTDAVSASAKKKIEDAGGTIAGAEEKDTDGE